jgi:hypothetical protein
MERGKGKGKAYCFVLLVEIVNVAIEDLDEKLDGHGGVHAGICYSESTLEAFEDAFTVAIELWLISTRMSLR